MRQQGTHQLRFVPRHRALLRTGPTDSHLHEVDLSWIVPVVPSAFGTVRRGVAHGTAGARVTVDLCWLGESVAVVTAAPNAGSAPSGSWAGSRRRRHPALDLVWEEQAPWGQRALLRTATALPVCTRVELVSAAERTLRQKRPDLLTRRTPPGI